MNQRNNLTNSELVLAPDNSMYHIRLKPEMIADNIILVGDPARVDLVASFLAILELMKVGKIIISQENLFDFPFFGWFEILTSFPNLSVTDFLTTFPSSSIRFIVVE